MNIDLPPMITHDEFNDRFTVLPEYIYSPDMSSSERLIALNSLYEVFYPFPMCEEIYTKMYLSLLRSMSKKFTTASIEQLNSNHRHILSGIVGGADSYTVIGKSGIGKSTAISHVLAAICEKPILTTETPFTQILPAVVVQCPWDSSVKGLLIEIARVVDSALHTNYYGSALRQRATTDMLIGLIANVCINHIGLLVVDEIQNVVNSKNGKMLVRSLTQLINNSGISICLVGTPECIPFLESDYKLARRSLGLQYEELKLDTHFVNFCRLLWKYQYLLNKGELTDGVIQWLYDHSGGITANVITLIHDAQETAILSGAEELNITALDAAYKKRLGLLHAHIQTQALKRSIHDTDNAEDNIVVSDAAGDTTAEKGLIAKLMAQSKETKIPFIKLLKAAVNVIVIEVAEVAE